jgi:hypothetical protein
MPTRDPADSMKVVEKLTENGYIVKIKRFLSQCHAIIEEKSHRKDRVYWEDKIEPEMLIGSGETLVLAIANLAAEVIKFEEAA